MESLWQCFHKGTTVEPHVTLNLFVQPLHYYDHFFPTQMLIYWVSLLFRRAVNATTSLLRPGLYGPTVMTVFAFQYFTKWLWMRRFCRILVLATSTFIIFGCFHMKSRKVCNKTMSLPARSCWNANHADCRLQTADYADRVDCTDCAGWVLFFYL